MRLWDESGYCKNGNNHRGRGMYIDIEAVKYFIQRLFIGGCVTAFTVWSIKSISVLIHHEYEDYADVWLAVMISLLLFGFILIILWAFIG